MVLEAAVSVVGVEFVDVVVYDVVFEPSAVPGDVVATGGDFSSDEFVGEVGEDSVGDSVDCEGVVSVLFVVFPDSSVAVGAFSAGDGFVT